MSTRRDLLLTQLYACHNKDGWFAPLNAALRGLTIEQAVQKVGQSANSIIGIMRHLIFWNERYLQRFQQGTAPPMEISNTETFSYQDSGETPGEWDKVQQRLEHLLVQWEEEISNCDEEKLDSPTFPDKEECWWISLAHLAIHNAHHIGQIVHIRKELGVWEAWEE